MVRSGVLPSMPVRGMIAATSVGIVEGEELLDLSYDEDSRAEVDFNVVMTSQGEFVEVQGTAEASPFSKEAIDSLLSLAGSGIKQLLQIQKTILDRLRA